MDDSPEEKLFLRFNVPLDLANADDARLNDCYNAIPNGLRQAVMRLAMLKVFPASPADMVSLLEEALRSQSETGRARGRPKIARKQTKAAAIPAAVVGQGQGTVVESVSPPVDPTDEGPAKKPVPQVVQVQAEAPAPQVAKEFPAEKPVQQPVVDIPAERPVQPAQPDPKLSRFAGMLGSSRWTMSKE